MKKDDMIREVMSMQGVGYQIAKSIVRHALTAPDSYKQIGPSGRRRPWSQQEAKRVLDAACKRITLVDEGG